MISHFPQYVAIAASSAALAIGEMHPQLTSAASAAFLLASSCALPPASAAEELDPRVLGGPPTFLGIEEVLLLLGGGAEPTVRPG